MRPDPTMFGRAADFFDRKPTGEYDEEAALALRAGEIMIRRGWTLYRDGGGHWIACETIDEKGYYFGPVIRTEEGATCWYTGLRPDPFTAICDAEEWLKSQEKK